MPASEVLGVGTPVELSRSLGLDKKPADRDEACSGTVEEALLQLASLSLTADKKKD